MKAVLCWCFSLTTLLANPLPGAIPDSIGVEPLHPGSVQAPAGLAIAGDRIYVSENKSNYVAILDLEGRKIGRFGSIGSKAGEFFRPSEIRVGSDGKIYVNDFGNERVQVFSPTGEPLGSVSVTGSKGMAISADGLLFLGLPGEKTVVSAFDSSGNRTNGFGALRKVTDLYQGKGGALDERFRIVINRVHLEADREGGVFVIYRFAPVVQHYDRMGELVWETRLTGALVDTLSERFLNRSRGAANFMMTATDGQAANVVTLGAAYDTPLRRVYVVLPGFGLAILDDLGKQVEILPLDAGQADEKLFPFRLEHAESGVLTGIDIFSGSLWRLRLPE